ncbi:hypothetical protein N7519_003462 [Penicillium mononematosum]|uniref:uncharacterized protein n=1 Tax=Penicillium mononematosum TaxID=268346 RepID=UPI002548942E|nr:uncharacterized protein N7519_003462 [Penicillium mononematosum]KAJ6188554.1 hypothetical protein N7519_003462 [Penicillium mononematosum]
MIYRKHYIPLESDPNIFTSLMHKLGVNPTLKFVDVWSLEQDEIQNLPGAVQALILILPACPAYEEQGVKCQSLKSDENEEVVWFRQTINNALGQKIILDSGLQLTPIIDAGSFLDRLMAAENRTEYLENSEYLDAVYQQAATSGSSEAPPAEAEIDHHYVCLVKRSCFLYELDGDREGPICRNVLAQDEDVLSKKGREIIQMYTQSDLEGSFSLLALIDSS